jgi:hypothetical protein
MKGLLFIILAALSAHSLSASKLSGAKIVGLELRTDYGEYVFIQTDIHTTEADGRAECSTNGIWEYTIRLDTEFRKAMYSTLLAALASQKPVVLRGDGESCNEFPHIESLVGVYIKG